MIIRSIQDVAEHWLCAQRCAKLWKGNGAQGLCRHEADGLLGVRTSHQVKSAQCIRGKDCVSSVDTQRTHTSSKLQLPGRRGV